VSIETMLVYRQGLSALTKSLALTHEVNLQTYDDVAALKTSLVDAYLNLPPKRRGFGGSAKAAAISKNASAIEQVGCTALHCDSNEARMMMTKTGGHVHTVICRHQPHHHHQPGWVH